MFYRIYEETARLAPGEMPSHTGHLHTVSTPEGALGWLDKFAEEGHTGLYVTVQPDDGLPPFREERISPRGPGGQRDGALAQRGPHRRRCAVTTRDGTWRCTLGHTHQAWAECPHGGEVLACLDEHQGGCAGAIKLREPLSATWRSFPRCDKHWWRRLEEQERINRTYPEHPPADFDPLYAGESWYEEG